jgi:hypothetical protein
MKRKFDWRTRLFAVISENRKREFCWGEWDCARFAAACVEAMTGEDFFAPYAGQYDDPLSSAKALIANGHHDLVSLASALFTECHPSMARVGDLAAIDCGENDYALGVFLGDHIGCITPKDGYGIVPRESAAMAWRVG